MGSESFSSNRLEYQMPCRLLIGFQETGTHSRARGGWHVSTLSGSGRDSFRPPIDFTEFTFHTTDDFHEMISYMIGISFSYYVLFIICDVNVNSSSTR